jgi:hypothetical protein
MNSKAANLLKVFTLEAPTLLDLEDRINEWLQDQSDQTTLEDISYQYGGEPKRGKSSPSSAMIVADVRSSRE